MAAFFCVTCLSHLSCSKTAASNTAAAPAPKAALTDAQYLVSKTWTAVKAKLVLSAGSDTVVRTDNLTAFQLYSVTFKGTNADDSQGIVTIPTMTGQYAIVSGFITITFTDPVTSAKTYGQTAIYSASATQMQFSMDNFAYPNASGAGTTTYARAVFVMN